MILMLRMLKIEDRGNKVRGFYIRTAFIAKTEL